MKEENMTQKYKSDNLVDLTSTQPSVTFYDRIITQMEVDEFDLYAMSDDEIYDLCEKIMKEIGASDPDMKKYIDADILQPSVHTYTYDSYPEPFHAPKDGYVISVCWAKGWSKNWGGEFITYHETEPEDVLSSYPGRVYISKGTPWCKITQPNIDAKQPLVYLQFRIR